MKNERLELRKFVAPEFIFGVGSRLQAGRYARNLGGRRVLVVTDPGVVKAGWTADVTGSLEEAGLECTVFSGVTSNPRAEEVMAGVEEYRQGECNAVVAVGGGSPMDCAKGIGIVSANGRHILEYEGVDQVPLPGPPLICVPTTGGTSADVSQFAIITDQAKRNKIAIISKLVVPDVSLIDPLTLTTMDPYLTACTGLDALTHAVEALVSNASSPVTDLQALEAIRLITANLLPSLEDLDDVTHRAEVMLGSLEAGLAFSNASLGAVHAMAHSLGGYLDLPHGECNALLHEHVVAFNFQVVPGKYIRAGEAMGLDMRGMSHSHAKKTVSVEINRLRRAARVDRSLGKIGVHRTDIPELAGMAMRDACLVTNPRQPNKRDLETIYEEAL